MRKPDCQRGESRHGKTTNTKSRKQFEDFIGEGIGVPPLVSSTELIGKEGFVSGELPHP
jgi:hypothetical protein